MAALAAELESAGLLLPADPPARGDVPGVRFAAETQAGVLKRLAGHIGLFGALVLLRCLPVRFALTAARAARLRQMCYRSLICAASGRARRTASASVAESSWHTTSAPGCSRSQDSNVVASRSGRTATRLPVSASVVIVA